MTPIQRQHEEACAAHAKRFDNLRAMLRVVPDYVPGVDRVGSDQVVLKARENGVELMAIIAAGEDYISVHLYRNGVGTNCGLSVSSSRVTDLRAAWAAAIAWVHDSAAVRGEV